MTHMIGYARVSTHDQNLRSQIDQLKKAGCQKIFKDKASGKTARHLTELAKLLEYVRKGDIVVVTQLDRLSRSLIDLLKLADQLGQQGVELLSLNESFDTTTWNGRLSFKIMGMLAEFERERIRERTLEGLKSARAQGRVGGRPRSLTEEQEASIYRMREQGDSIRQIARTFEVSIGTISRALKRHELSNGEGKSHR